ncbi:MAG: GUN4 domain-containing protein [Pseudanabaenaceae cyanobacterium bins.68]|nr:GUN4 domain-containing protein [Pseudanabaenaceae cyanobacterium bins.68]
MPEPSDLVLGGENPSHGLILGGIQGVQQRFYQASSETEKIAVLAEAINQGQKGLDLVIRSLKERSPQVSWAAYELLKQSGSPRAKLALQYFSERVNYLPLDQLLKAQNWEAADQWTTAILRDLSNLPTGRALKGDHIANCAGADLQVIDRLWARHSRDRFGLKAQAQIWQVCKARRWDPGERWLLFGRRVKWYNGQWLRQHQLNFHQDAVVGHLPFGGGIFTIEAIATQMSNALT